jgi:hypothetical protein
LPTARQFADPLESAIAEILPSTGVMRHRDAVKTRRHQQLASRQTGLRTRSISSVVISEQARDRRHSVRHSGVAFEERLFPRRITLCGQKESDAMNDEPKKQEPEIMPPVPKVEPERPGPEIPPDKDAPERESPIRAANGALLWN